MKKQEKEGKKKLIITAKTFTEKNKKLIVFDI